MTGKKVIIDTSVLIAASLSHTSQELGGTLIQDHFYRISKPLFDYFQENIDEGIGLVTSDIENSAKSKIIDVIVRKISKITNSSTSQLYNDLNNYSQTLMYIINSLSKNINLLIRVPINETEIDKLGLRVHDFYNRLKLRLSRKNPMKRVRKRAREGIPGLRAYFRKFAKEYERKNLFVYEKLSRKLRANPPDINDCRILAQAIYLSKRKKDKIFIASTDYHFSKVKLEADDSLNTFIPDNIAKEFKIKCDWPDNILRRLRM